MDTALWIVQSLAVGIFLATGLIKLTQPRLKMAAGPMVGPQTSPTGSSAPLGWWRSSALSG